MTPYDGPERRGQDQVLTAVHELKFEMVDRLARIETEQKGTNARLDDHSKTLKAHNVILLGDGGRQLGFANKIDKLERHSAGIATAITFGMIAVWELIKEKLIGK